MLCEAVNIVKSCITPNPRIKIKRGWRNWRNCGLLERLELLEDMEIPGVLRVLVNLEKLEELFGTNPAAFPVAPGSP